MEEPSDIEKKIAEIEAELASVNHRRTQLLDELVNLRQRSMRKNSPAQLSLHLREAPVTNQSSQEEKIRLFRSLFKGREDVFARRFESAKTGKTGYAPVHGNEWIAESKVRHLGHDTRAFVPINDEVIRNHLRGFDPQEYPGKDYTIGVYPLLTDETCWFLTIDFDKSTWSEDTRAFLDTCIRYQVPAALERSRSGNGGHVWIFFETPVHAALARRLGTLLLTNTMSRRPEIGMDSYDRLFPSQDTMPKGGFGNLIALPCRRNHVNKTTVS